MLAGQSHLTVAAHMIRAEDDDAIGLCDCLSHRRPRLGVDPTPARVVDMRTDYAAHIGQV